MVRFKPAWKRAIVVDPSDKELARLLTKAEKAKFVAERQAQKVKGLGQALVEFEGDKERLFAALAELLNAMNARLGAKVCPHCGKDMLGES